LPMTAHEPADAMLYHFADSALARQLNILQFNPAPCTQDKHLLKGSQRFASNIESAAAPAGRWTQLSPLAVARGVCRTLRGYQRIAFA
ncbi:MAG: glycosyl transferase, putative, gt25A, partial [Pseudomonadota bacterium]